MSALPGSVFDGDAATVWARFEQVPDGTVRLVGTRTHAGPPESLGEASLTAADHDSALSRMAVAGQIETLIAVESAQGAHSRQALELAVAHQLVSPLTHFLLVETRAEANKAADMPDRDLAYFAEGSEHFADYVEAVRWAQECAMANRQGRHRRLCWARSGSQLPGAARSCLLAALVGVSSRNGKNRTLSLAGHS